MKQIKVIQHDSLDTETHQKEVNEFIAELEKQGRYSVAVNSKVRALHITTTIVHEEFKDQRRLPKPTNQEIEDTLNPVI